MTLDEDFRSELHDLANQDRLRETRLLRGLDRAHPMDVAGRQLLSFCSNDYLGLAGHPALALAAAESVAHAGFGAAASRLVSGEAPDHRALESALSTYLCRPATLLFPTGYQTNIGVLTALARPGDLVVSDAANHASIIDGCRLSRATVAVYRHCDALDAERGLATPGTFRRRLLVTESVFSMDGDRAPLVDLAAVATRFGAGLIVDEAHALGTVGPAGQGLSAQLHVNPDVIVGTLGKALGAFGGFATGSDLLRSILVNRSRPFIYSTSCPPSLAAAATAAVTIAGNCEGEALRQNARLLSTRLRSGLAKAGIPTAGQDLIIPVVVGLERDALSLSARLLESGILVPAIRPPTVPAGTSRLRITVSAAHTSADVDRLLATLTRFMSKPPTGRTHACADSSW